MSRPKLPELIKPTVLDRVVSYFSPVAGRERMQARAQMAVAERWIGASFNRRATKNWFTTVGSADADLLIDLPTLRNRSRDLARNNPLALGAINTTTTSAVGTGLMLRSCLDADALGMTPEEAQQWQRKTQREFGMWAGDAKACHTRCELTFYQLQELAFRSALEAGDSFALLPMVKRKSSIYQTKVQLVEADRVVNKDYQQNNLTLAGGIERDDSGAPKAYHILKQHPGALAISAKTWEWDIVPAFGAKTGRRNVIHLFDPKRIDQSRGYPYLAPVIEPLKQLGDYTHAELTAAVISGMFTVFVKSENGQGLNGGFDGPGAAPAKAGDDLNLAPGAILDLAPGEEIQIANPGRPNAAFDPFVQANLRQIGVALELPFEVLIKHFTASYSAARAAMLEAWRFFKGRRAWLAQMFCQPIYEAWMEEAVAMGRVVAPGFFDDPALRAAYLSAEWIGDAQGQIDPLKEVMAAEKRLDLLLTDRNQEKAALDGGDWEGTIARRSYEQKLIDESGVPIVVPKGQMEAPPTAPPDPEDLTDLETQ